MSEGESVTVSGGGTLAPGDVRLVEAGDQRICLARTEDGELLAVDDTCTHEDESLSEGWVEGDCIECPAHNSIFDLRTGEAKTLPATEPVATYRVRLEGDDAVIELATATGD